MTTFIPHKGEAPQKGRERDAAYDLRSKQLRIIQPGDWTLVQTGFQMGIPAGHVGLVCSRSGLALKHGVSVMNAPGIIDPDYIGDVGVILHNQGKEPFAVQKGDRVAQLLILETPAVQFSQTEKELASLERGDQGYGSSGVA